MANESTADRVIRLVAGVVLVALGVLGVHGTWGIVLDVLGAVLLLTGAIGFCPLYRVFGFSTK
jgi:hypothetical protein